MERTNATQLALPQAPAQGSKQAQRNAVLNARTLLRVLRNDAVHGYNGSQN